MFAQIAAFEFRYQLRQPAFWVISILFGLMGFGLLAASDNISISGGGNVNVNAPITLSVVHYIFNIFFMLGSVSIVANAVTRDIQTGYGPLILSSRITKFDYLYGRFAGAFLTAALAYCSIGFGMLLGTVMPWLDPETLGPFRPGDYVYAYLVFGLPGLFFTSAALFTLATATRSMMAAYVGVVGLLILYLILSGTLGTKPEYENISAWVEPFGAAAHGLATRYWTPEEQNTLNPALSGVLLGNRLLWTGISVALLVAAYLAFNPAARGASEKRQAKLQKLDKKAADTASVDTSRPLPQPRYGLASMLTQLIKRTRFESALIFRSPAYVVLILLGVAFNIAVLARANEIYGAPTLLLTRTVISVIESNMTLVTLVIAIYYAGELVWRDRDRKIHEIIDATSAPDWTFLVPKTLALSLVLMSTLLVSVLSGMLMQVIRGYTDFEIDKYLVWFVLRNTVSMTIIAALAIFLQGLAPNKFVGWALMVVYLILTIIMSSLGLDHLLYRYGAAPSVPLSDMNGMGDFVRFEATLHAYWGACAVLLLLVTFALWRRGTEARFKPRLQRVPARLRGVPGVIGAVALAAFLGLGVFIFINTNVWNTYVNLQTMEKKMANYEKALLAFENTPQPAVTDVKLVLDLDPHAPRLDTTGSYVIENTTDAPLPEVHLRWIEGLKMRTLNVEGAKVSREWPEFNYRIYRFDQPLAPGERRTVTFSTERAQRGFRNSDNMMDIVDNGSFLNNTLFAPIVGMDRSMVLTDRAKRRKYGLPPELRMRDLNDPEGLKVNYLGVDWVNADITVTTVADQTPIAPGYKISDTTSEGRRTARFVTEAPILHFFSVQSARYDVRRETYKGVALEVYHHPQHNWNTQRMIDALKTGLDYYQSAFGPYQFRQARILEFPGYGSFAQAFANTMPYSESIGFTADLRNPEKLDYVTFVTAHELAHQWWAHQLVGANVQGATSLSETLAEYSALMVMEKLYGADKIRRFLKHDLDIYLRSRGGERLGESPLMRVEANQGYIHYNKGGHVLYLLRDQIGEDAVNRALRQLLEAHRFGTAPYPRSTDLIAALRANAPADKQVLITDLLERITLYDFKATEAKVQRRADGKWVTTLTVEARKLYSDALGVEKAVPLNETVELGLFTAEPGHGAFDSSNVVLLERRPIRSGTQTFRFVTDVEPKFAGVDPYNRWIDRDSNDNIKPASS